MICENCGKEHDGSYGSGRFCCKECARSFSTKKSKNELKEVKCIDCGKTILVGKRSNPNKCRCDECHKKYQLQNNHTRVVSCPVCGRKHIKGEICENEFCKKHTYKQFKRLVEYFGFDKSKLKTIYVEDEFNRIKDIIYDLYWNKGLSFEEIGNLYNYPYKDHIFDGLFKYLNIPIKTLQNKTYDEFFNNQHDYREIRGFKQSYHVTWDKKLVFLRSSYEEDYANILDNQKILYEVESLKIKYFDTVYNKERIAIPDFYIPNENLIVEIKSSWTINIQNMKDKYKSYKKLGYNFKLILNHKEVNINEL